MWFVIAPLSPDWLGEEIVGVKVKFPLVNLMVFGGKTCGSFESDKMLVAGKNSDK